MSPGLDRKSTAKVQAFNSRASHRVRYTEEREAATAADEAFLEGLSTYIEMVSGYAPDFPRMKRRDLEAWCARYHRFQRQADAIVVRPAPRYGREFRRRFWGMNA